MSSTRSGLDHKLTSIFSLFLQVELDSSLRMHERQEPHPPTNPVTHPACYRQLGLWRCDEKIEIPHVRAQTLSTLPVLQLERISARFCEALVQTSPMRSSSRNNTCLLTWRIGSQEHECGSQWNLERQYWWSRCLFCCSHCKKGFGHLRTTIYDPLQQLSR